MDGTTNQPSSLPNTFADLVRSDFWFLDGNLIIIAGQAAFKVHRGQLERHSEIFNGLFSIPQPQDQELFDGCIHIELYDNPSDVFYFLSALYDGLCVSLPVFCLKVADRSTGTSRHLELKISWLLLVFCVYLPSTSWNIFDKFAWHSWIFTGRPLLLVGTNVNKQPPTLTPVIYPGNYMHIPSL